MDIRSQFNSIRDSSLDIPREYIDVRSKSQKSLIIKHKKRTSFFVDLQKESTKIPGPGKYITNPEDPKIYKKIDKKINFNEEAKKCKGTYIEAIIKDKKGIPGVGNYQVNINTTDKNKERYRALGDRIRKQAPVFKPTIFYQSNRDTLNVDPGTYNIVQPFGQKKSFKTDLVNSQQDNKKDKHRTMSLPKLPTPQTYFPVESGTFEHVKSRESSHNYVKTSKEERFKKYSSIGPGPKYSLIAQWSPKSRENPGMNIFRSMSTSRQAGVYH